MYKITVLNKQTIDGNTDTVEETSYGDYSEKNGKIYIRYKTKSELGDISTLIIAQPHEVTVKRSGAMTSVMVYKKGVKTEFLYHMPFGTVTMGIETSKIIIAIDEGIGTIRLCYKLLTQSGDYFNDTIIKISEG